MLNSNMSRYRENQITSSSSEETVILLYDGAIRFLRSAIHELGDNNIPQKAVLVEKTVKILDYLQSCLDADKGGGIAENLNKLYDYMQVKLTEANLHNDMPKLEEVLKLLLTIREGWHDVCSKNKAARNGDAGRASSHGSVENEQAAEQRLARKVGVKA